MAVFSPEIYSNLTQVTSLFDVADSFTDGLIGFGIWLIITLGALFISSGFDFREGFIVASFVGLISGIFLNILGLVQGWVTVLGVVLFVIAVIFAWITGNRTGT